MERPIYEVMYEIWKNGVYDGHDVGFLYMRKEAFAEKYHRLTVDYPKSKGYELKLKKERTINPPKGM